MPNGGASATYNMAPMMNAGPPPNYAPGPPGGQQPMHGGMRPMHEDPMNNGQGAVFMNGPTSQQQQQFVGQPPQQMPNGMANPHGNMMSPHMQPMMSSPQTTPGPPQGGPQPQQQQQPHVYNQHQGMMSPQQPQQPQQQPGMYPPQGMSPHNNMVLQQVMQNSNTPGRVMSPSQQQQQQTNGGMMSPHPHLGNPQQPPMHNMVQQQQPSPQMVGGPGMMPPNGPMQPGKKINLF